LRWKCGLRFRRQKGTSRKEEKYARQKA
jgi:hypothetical protein